jgi:hypothetical protein
VAYADDVHLQGPPPSAIEAFRFLVAATAEIGLSPSLSKCAPYAPSADTGAAAAAALGIAHRTEGLVAAGSSLGSDAFVQADAHSRAAAVESLVTSLTSLPLSTQDKFLLLRSSLQARLTHLTRTTPWQRLSPHIAAAERQVLLAALLLVDHPPPEDLPADPVVAQLILPLRFGGFGPRVTTTLEANAAFLAAAGIAEVAMQSAPAPFRPFHPGSPISASLKRQWAMLRDAAPGLWPGPAWEFEGTRLAPILVDAQRLYGRHLAEQRFASLLASAPASCKGSRLKARLHSCACRPASIWLDTMPTSWPLTLSNSEWTSSARLRLGLPAGPANAPSVRCACGFAVLPDDPDHSLTCPCLAQQRTSRHDFV